MTIHTNITRLLALILYCQLLLISTVCGWGSSDRIKLKDVDTITLYKDKMTNFRRTSAVPQLSCKGGSAGCFAFVPKVVQCTNKGFDGYDVQWECKADMDNAYRFGFIQVSCEGYDYPDDPYILRGSCGLEYTIDHVDGARPGYYSEQMYTTSTKPSMLSNLVAIAIIALVVYGIYRSCLYQQQYSSSNDDYPDPNQRRPGTFGSSAPPPPGFRQEYYPDGDSCYRSGAGATRGSGSGGGGFWSGAATGGLLGYLFGSRNSSYNNYSSWGGNRHRESSPGWGSFGSRRYSGGSGNGSGSGSRTASGFGGTVRR